jgi:hypothetical protein
LLGPIDRQALVPEIARKQACRLSASGLSTADDAASLEIGEERVSRRSGGQDLLSCWRGYPAAVV